MPYKGWKPTCSCRTSYSPTATVCPDCGQEAEYMGWQSNMYESMARYQTLYELKPIGPHRRFQDELFRSTTVACSACEGRGLLDRNGGADWESCRVCRGLGAVFYITPEEVRAIRDQVLEAFPEAAASPVPGFANAILIQDLSQGTIEGFPKEG